MEIADAGFDWKKPFYWLEFETAAESEGSMGSQVAPEIESERRRGNTGPAGPEGGEFL